MKQSEANEISLVCLVRAHRLALLSQGGPPACRSRHRAPPSPNAVMSVGIASESNAGGLKECLPLQFLHSAGDFVEDAANATSRRASSAVHFADGTASVASAST